LFNQFFYYIALLINNNMIMSEKIKYVIEEPIKTSIGILYDMISSPSGLSEWFCDDVNVKGNSFIFMWDGSEERAEIIRQKNNEYIRFKWDEDEDDDEKSYFELRIKIDELTKDVAIVVTDFAKDEEEAEENQLVCKSQIEDLKRRLGA
jgi:uncharacterized protein YndB with AHSA1/START domain